eukprot:1759222-Rhodomonas_salina.3
MRSGGHCTVAGKVLLRARTTSVMRHVGTMGKHMGEKPYAYHMTAQGKTPIMRKVKAPLESSKR